MFMLIQTRTRYEKAAAQAQEKVSMLETLAALETEGKAKDEERKEGKEGKERQERQERQEGKEGKERKERKETQRQLVLLTSL